MKIIDVKNVQTADTPHKVDVRKLFNFEHAWHMPKLKKITFKEAKEKSSTKFNLDQITRSF